MAGGRTYVDSHAARRDRAVPYRKETIFAALDAGLIFAQDARSLFQQDDAAVVRINVAGNDAADIYGLTGIHCGLQHARNERLRKDQHIAVANVARSELHTSETQSLIPISYAFL